ncbi:hypothetical protein IFM89_016863 [Coptis chinensis]|uniref:F-box domain-containing protein n=1 Tax=Coptis chinensis TaxID=261450 RepID=A0A835GYJ7_9MAGN|nr:hypothetical protein IFM89_016863 [Coptis chinensis]
MQITIQESMHESMTDNEDRISTLPDSLLTHILSSLDMKQIVQTSVLSKTWTSIWLSFPYLNFDFRNYCTHNLIRHDCPCVGMYKDFLNKVFFFRESSTILAFRLNWQNVHISNSRETNTLIQNAVRRNVRELDLQFCGDCSIFRLSPYLFTCKSLTTLKLTILCYLCGETRSDLHFLIHKVLRRPLLTLPEALNLPSLKTLHLQSLHFQGAIEVFLSSCPLLETLILITCGLDQSNEVTISGPQLKYLEIDRLYGNASTRSKEKCKINVSAPNLTTFRCRDDTSNEYAMENVPSLVMADIDIESIDELSTGLLQMLGELHNVIRSLKLSAPLVEVIPKAFELRPAQFSALKHLKLKTWFSRESINCIKCILQNSYCLETLIVDAVKAKVGSSQDKDIRVFGPTVISEQSDLYKLRSVKIGSILEGLAELEFLKYLLKNAISLERLVVTFKHSPDQQTQVMNFSERLLALPRASLIVEILSGNNLVHTKKSENMDGEGRMSYLPESIVDQIRSLLPVKDMIQSRLVSKSWRSEVWKSSPFLFFDVSMYYDHDSSHNQRYMQGHHCFPKLFKELVHKVLYFRDNNCNLRILHLNCGVDDSASSSLINLVTTYAVCYSVQELDLQFYPKFSCLLPKSLFTSTSLTTLRLRLKMAIHREYGNDWSDENHMDENDEDRRFGMTVTSFDIPETFSLPSLKTLHLQSVYFPETQFMQQILSSCPVLETLIIINCVLDENDALTISATQLEHLEIDMLWFYNPGNHRGGTKCNIKVYAPNLNTFRCKADISSAFSVEDLFSLVEADIEMKLPLKSTEEKFLDLSSDRKKELGKKMLKLLGGLYNAKSISLSAPLLEFMTAGPTMRDGYLGSRLGPETGNTTATPPIWLPQSQTRSWLMRNVARQDRLKSDFVISKAIGLLPTPFSSLRKLKLETWLTRDSIRGIKYLLQNSCNLETLLLIITRINLGSTTILDYWGANSLSNKCNLNHLRSIEIQVENPVILGRLIEIDIFKYLLKNAIALEKLIINSKAADSQRQLMKFGERILALPRSSSSVEILYF